MADVFIVSKDGSGIEQRTEVVELCMIHFAAFRACFDAVGAHVGKELSPWHVVSIAGDDLDLVKSNLEILRAELEAAPESWMVRVFDTGMETLPEFVGVDGANGEWRLLRSNAVETVGQLLDAVRTCQQNGSALLFDGD